MTEEVTFTEYYPGDHIETKEAAVDFIRDAVSTGSSHYTLKALEYVYNSPYWKNRERIDD